MPLPRAATPCSSRSPWWPICSTSCPRLARAGSSAETELRALFERYPVVPGKVETEGPDAAAWFTHFPNDPRVGEPDRTIDYIFFSPDITLGARHVRQHDTRTLSDHFPIVAEFELGK